MPTSILRMRSRTFIILLLSISFSFNIYPIFSSYIFGDTDFASSSDKRSFYGLALDGQKANSAHASILMRWTTATFASSSIASLRLSPLTKLKMTEIFVDASNSDGKSNPKINSILEKEGLKLRLLTDILIDCQQNCNDAKSTSAVESFIGKAYFSWLRQSFNMSGLLVPLQARGIIYIANDQTVISILTSIKSLRMLQPDAKPIPPIEVFYNSHDLSQDNQKRLLDLSTSSSPLSLLTFRGGGSEVPSKALALFTSSFEDALILEGTSVFLDSPLRLFEHTLYQKTGAFFFKDQTRFSTDLQDISLITAMLHNHTLSSTAENLRLLNGISSNELDSGAILINRKKHIASVLGILYLNHIFRMDRQTRQWVDKETFWMAFEIMQMDYSFASIFFTGLLGVSDKTGIVCGYHVAHTNENGDIYWFNGGFSEIDHNRASNQLSSLTHYTLYQNEIELQPSSALASKAVHVPHHFYNGSFCLSGKVVPMKASHLTTLKKISSMYIQERNAQTVSIVIILGAPTTATGEPGSDLKDRLDAFLSMFKKEEVDRPVIDAKKILILTGGAPKTYGSAGKVSEASAMKQYLDGKLGSSKLEEYYNVFLDQEALDTYDNFVNTNKILSKLKQGGTSSKWSSAIFITNDWHVDRSLPLCEAIIAGPFDVDCSSKAVVSDFTKEVTWRKEKEAWMLKNWLPDRLVEWGNSL